MNVRTVFALFAFMGLGGAIFIITMDIISPTQDNQSLGIVIGLMALGVSIGNFLVLNHIMKTRFPGIINEEI